MFKWCYTSSPNSSVLSVTCFPSRNRLCDSVTTQPAWTKPLFSDGASRLGITLSSPPAPLWVTARCTISAFFKLWESFHCCVLDTGARRRGDFPASHLNLNWHLVTADEGISSSKPRRPAKCHDVARFNVKFSMCSEPLTHKLVLHGAIYLAFD